jgi:imidazolonepropionase-like amidohydrolase
MRCLAFLMVFLSADSILAADLIIRGGTVLNPRTQSSTVSALWIQDRNIKRIGKIPEMPGAQEVDASGLWILPGLIDSHTHTFGHLGPGGAFEYYGVKGGAKLTLYAGVTAFLDLFNDEVEIFPVRDRQRRTGMIAADVFAAGACLTAPGGHCSEYPTPTRIVNSPEGARAEVREMAKRRPDVIKLVYDHAFPSPTLTRETMEAVIEAAHQHGIKTVTHIGTWQDAHEAVEAGSDALTHLYETQIPGDLVQLLASKGTVMIPTLTVQGELLNIYEDPSLLDRSLLQEVTGSPLRDAYRNIAVEEPIIKFFLGFQRRHRGTDPLTVRRLVQSGVPIAAGTDVANLGTFLGYSVHREMELLVTAGMTAWQALAAATTVAADFLGQPYGVEEGDIANLLIVGRSPIERITHTQDIRFVIYRGQVVDRNALLEEAKGLRRYEEN